MYLYPKDFLSKVEFDKVVKRVKSYCLGDSAEAFISDLEIQTDPSLIDELLEETREYKELIEDAQNIPLYKYDDIRPEIPLLKKDGYVLSLDAISRILNVIKMSSDLQTFSRKESVRKMAPLFYQKVSSVSIENNILSRIYKVINEEGEVRPDASDELMRIHRSISSSERALEKEFRQVSKMYKQKGFLADTTESMRNGRRVLTVPAENKRRVGGIVHDESATGKTVYIEPDQVVALNNAIFNLHTEKKKEIYKVLKDLCSDLRPYADDFMNMFLLLRDIDVIQSKARYAIAINACKPKLKPNPHFGFVEAFNPVLFLKNKAENLPTIPFDLELYKNNRMLVLSGPNAGGKSVTMKTVGLLQVMLQSGLLVPVSSDATFGVFTRMLADIGDQQSLEDDLSTYSSRLLNMKVFIENADKDSLVLIDEFGSGTDPKVGGAIAEAILKQLNYSKTYGVITTHYSNLKYFAFKHSGVLNGSMEFDRDELRPTYRLKVGKPGSSFAYEIAQKIGLPNSVLKYARHKTGKNEHAIDDLLVHLQSEKQLLDEKMDSLKDKEHRINKLVANYEEMHKELEYRRKKLKLEAKEQGMIQVQKQTRALQKLIKELKEKSNLEKAKALSTKIKTEQKEAKEEIQELKQEVYYKEEYSIDSFKTGSHVKMRSGSSVGTIKSIEKNVAQVEMGFLTVAVPVHDLVPANAPIEINKKRTINTDQVSGIGSFENKLDIRGYTRKDAIAFVQEFMDLALLNNAIQLKIIHGRGNGILRKAVHAKLKEYKDVKEVWHPEEEFGGEGVTHIQL